MNHLLAILLTAILWGNFDDIAQINNLKRKAKEAYNTGKYSEAIQHYKYLTDSLQVDDDNIKLNLANAYYHLKDTANAKNNYNSLLASADRSVKSVAHQQLGIMNNRDKKFKEALDHFKEALKANPANGDARYNYELLKKVLREQEKKEQEQNKDQNKDQDKKDDQNKDKKDQEQSKDKNKQDENKKDQENKDKKGEENKEQDKEKQKQEEEKKKGEEKDKEQKEEQQPKEGEENKDQEQKEEQQPSLSENLKDMKISEEKAKMILEALKNNEIQYLQQNKRKATKKKDTDKPDW
jgi:Ca-activated chloride channel homolog